MRDAQRRRKRILELIAQRAIGTQDELAALLKREGLACTQASVSRDIRELGLVKSAGRYLPPPPRTDDGPGLDAATARRIRRVQTAGDNLVVVQTPAGEASVTALAIDREQWPSVVGTVAGDDTLFIACDGREDQKRTLKKLLAIMTSAAETPARGEAR
jgi:transcriptional regulator of arginine metabolism